MAQKDDNKELGAALKAYEPPKDLAARIIARISARERRILKFKIGVSICMFFVSAGTALWGVFSIFSSLSQSGSLAIASLALSDLSSMVANFPDFILSLAESFPVFTAAMALGGIMVAIWSMAMLLDEFSFMKTDATLSHL